MKNHAIAVLSPWLFCVFIVHTQSQDLAALQSKLTVDCKSIRGHAGRIVAEASANDFNRAVAAAHLDQVAKFHALMEQDLKATATLMTKRQRENVAPEMEQLTNICQFIGEAVEELQKEFALSSPDTDSIRRKALKLRNEMNDGYRIHERMKKKLGII